MHKFYSSIAMTILIFHDWISANVMFLPRSISISVEMFLDFLNSIFDLSVDLYP